MYKAQVHKFTVTFWFTITSDSDFMLTSYSQQSELRRFLDDLLQFSLLLRFVIAIVACV